MSRPIRSVWLITREYAGIAEAGGVKNVACSLSEGLVRRGIDVTVFIPRYGCVRGLAGTRVHETVIEVLGTNHAVAFDAAEANGVRVVLVSSRLFAEKKAVYVYTAEEEGLIPGAIRGKGHHDTDCINALFQKSVLEFSRLSRSSPDIVHCQDAHTACLPAMARSLGAYRDAFARSSFVTTIHNAGPGYRQTIPGIHRAAELTGLSEEVLSSALLNGNAEPFLLASLFGALTTVSPWYAGELTSSSHNLLSEGFSGELERRGIQVVGILNGIDAHRYTPEETEVSLLPYSYSPESGDLSGKYRCRDRFLSLMDGFETTPDIATFGTLRDEEGAVYFAYHGRIAWQKGLDVLASAARIVLERLPEARFVVLGQGAPELEAVLMEMSRLFRGRFLFVRGYERSLARLAVAHADFLVLPSVFEPCGLEDYIGQLYGTIPVAHAVGGLQKIEHGVTGFLYREGGGGPASAPRLLSGLLIELGSSVRDSKGRGAASVPQFLAMIRESALRVRRDCAWDTVIERDYLPLYQKMFLATY